VIYNKINATFLVDGFWQSNLTVLNMVSMICSQFFRWYLEEKKHVLYSVKCSMSGEYLLSEIRPFHCEQFVASHNGSAAMIKGSGIQVSH
jgi:hypothetical protein